MRTAGPPGASRTRRDRTTSGRTTSSSAGPPGNAGSTEPSSTATSASAATSGRTTAGTPGSRYPPTDRRDRPRRRREPADVACELPQVQRAAPRFPVVGTASELSPAIPRVQALGLKPGELVRVRSARRSSPRSTTAACSTGFPSCPRCSSTVAGPCRSRTGPTRRVPAMASCGACTTPCTSRRSAATGPPTTLQAACLTFWRKRGSSVPATERDKRERARAEPHSATKRRRTSTAPFDPGHEGRDEGRRRYRCQATDIPNASQPLRFRHVGPVRQGPPEPERAEDRPRPGHRALQLVAGLQQEAASEGTTDLRRPSVPLRRRTTGEGRDTLPGSSIFVPAIWCESRARRRSRPPSTRRTTTVASASTGR